MEIGISIDGRLASKSTAAAIESIPSPVDPNISNWIATKVVNVNHDTEITMLFIMLTPWNMAHTSVF
jgi:hypothetical protein